ncbi:RagB/SusD family nutrient uptake outer membrane protein [Bacteroides sp.]
MKNICIKSIFMASVITLCACEDFLDRAPGVNLDEDKVFSSYETAYRYQADIYSNLKKGFNVLGSHQPAPIACATDEAEASAGWHTSNEMNVGSYDGVDNVTDNDYTGIRKANLFLSKKDIIPFPDQGTKNRLVGEVHFLRAFYFHDIIKRYGGMPILHDKILYPNDDMNFPRNSYKECVGVILSDLETAISLLPLSVENNELGRVTKGAAMALKARVLLYAASPLWDGEFTNEDKWELAAKAALDVIELKENGENVYALYNTGAGATDFEQQFFVRPPENKEVIFWYNDGPKNFSQDEIMVWAPNGEGIMGAGAVWPTQNFVDMYEMANGKLITDPESGYDPLNPYEGRDPRFYKTIIYNGSVWQGMTIETFVGGKHRLKSTDCRTGYYVRKYLPEPVKNNSSVSMYHNWQYMRLAEVYLNYAEAINEAEGPEKAYQYVDAIRKRSGMPQLPEKLSKEEMRERIKRERAIELSFEEHRWWDVRRWMDGEKYFNGPFYGMNITKNSDGSFTYDKIVFEDRIFLPKMNLYPIPISEMNKNNQYIQNPGW